MSNAEALRRLAQEVIGAHEDRVLLRASILNDINQIKAETRDCQKEAVNLLRTFSSQHQEMGKQLRSGLEQFISGLNAAESSRQSTAREDAGQRQDEITRRIAVVDDLRKDLVDKLREMAEAHQQMGKQLRTDLDQFMSRLSEGESDRKTATQAYLSEVQADIRETAAAWKELIQRIQASRAESPSAVTKAAETASSFPPDEKKNTIVEETIAPSDTTDEVQAHAPDEGDGLNRENLRKSIVSILKGHADGMKMIQLAELLDIENWRSLIPVMRELLDERILEKDGSVYFISPS